MVSEFYQPLCIDESVLWSSLFSPLGSTRLQLDESPTQNKFNTSRVYSSSVDVLAGTATRRATRLLVRVLDETRQILSGKKISPTKKIAEAR